MKCLQCSKEAKPVESYQGTPIRICEDGHRTGKDTRPLKESLEGRGIVETSWLERKAS